jgi:PHP family Zn ribbon phosphoesterase
MKTYRADLHVHTVLSPCAGVEMIPPLIVQEALQRNINLIAITDHNASANIAAVQKAARDTSLTVLPGMELQTEEDVHSLCLFDTLDQIETFQAFIDTKLPAIKNKPDFFGEQFVVDETGDFVRREEQLVILSANINLKEAQIKVAELGGLFIPAHINRKAFGLFSHLGLLPDDMHIDALEVSRHISLEEAIQKYPGIKRYPLIQNGDVHFLADFLGATLLHIDAPTIPEIKLALKNLDGRSLKNAPAA